MEARINRRCVLCNEIIDKNIHPNDHVCLQCDNRFIITEANRISFENLISIKSRENISLILSVLSGIELTAGTVWNRFV